MKAFANTDEFALLYPETAARLTHQLADHPLFTLEALAALAARMRTSDIEYNRGDLPLGIEFDSVPANGLSVADTIDGIHDNGSWMVLKLVQQDFAYHALLTDALAEIGPAVQSRTGAMLKQQAFIFISSPHSVTPLHFDPEHNILLQLRGTKTMTVFAATDEEIAPPEAHEGLHMGAGHRNLPWKSAYARRGQRFELVPGDGLYVPLMAPHSVLNGPDVSISFSITWRSAHSFAEADARGMNALLRRAGLTPSTPGRYPARNLTKSFAYRAIRKLSVR